MLIGLDATIQNPTWRVQGISLKQAELHFGSPSGGVALWEVCGPAQVVQGMRDAEPQTKLEAPLHSDSLMLRTGNVSMRNCAVVF